MTPIFIHALFRAGTTYLFNVFRRSGQGYWCYQEPENEFLRRLNGNPDKLLKMGSDTPQALRHPPMEKPYFWELYQIKDVLSHLFRKSFSYDDFFVERATGLPEDQSRYFGALIAHAKGRPVLQFCRSAGRVGALKTTFGGTHIHLWREPRNQWWSFKVNNYFDNAVLLIYNARGMPPVLAETARRCGIVEFHSDDVDREFEHARAHSLPSVSNYFAFYALWLYAYLECEKCSDITISIDKLSVDRGYRRTTLQDLERLGIEGLDFSDCSVPRTEFSADEEGFFTQIEHQIQDLFRAHGYNALEVNHARAAHETIVKLREGEPAEPLRDVARAREMTLRYLDQFTQAEARVVGQEQRAVAAETRAVGQEQRARVAETRAAGQEQRAIVAETRAAGQEQRAVVAEVRAAMQEQRAVVAEARYRSLQEEWISTKVKIGNLSSSNHHWWTLSESLKRELQAVYASASWRVTGPARLVHSLLVRSGKYFSKKYSGSPKKESPSARGERAEALSRLTPRALRIYSDLKDAMATRWKEKG